jgi:hypothetical protein
MPPGQVTRQVSRFCLFRSPVNWLLLSMVVHFVLDITLYGLLLCLSLLSC